MDLQIIYPYLGETYTYRHIKLLKLDEEKDILIIVNYMGETFIMKNFYKEHVELKII